MISIGILGARGRMGQAIARLLEQEEQARLAGGADLDDDPGALARSSDVLADFSTPDALQPHLDAAIAAGTAILVGTTGLRPDHHRALDEAAKKVAVLQTANTSIGVNVLRLLIEEAARRLGPDWDIEILEMHHRAKLD